MGGVSGFRGGASSTGPDPSSGLRLLRTDPPGHPHRRGRGSCAVGDLYTELGITGQVLDLMSLVGLPHFHEAAHRRTSRCWARIRSEPQSKSRKARGRVVHDLNADPVLPFADASFDAAVCCVSVDYLTRPVEVFAEVARTLRPGGAFRHLVLEPPCFPTESDPRVAHVVRRGALRDRRALLPTSRTRSTDATIERRTAPTHAGRPALRGLGPASPATG